LLALVLRVALVAALLGAGLSRSPVQAQDASPSAPPSVAPAATELPEGITARMALQIDEVVAKVPPIRGLEPLADIRYRVLDQDGFRAEFEALFREEFPPELVAAEQDFYKRMGFLRPDDDLEELLLSLYASQVLAFYDPRTATFTLVGPIERIGPLERVVIAHEYGHALQDQRWDLEGTRIRDHSRSDEILAQASLTEGDAVAVMYDWAARELSVADLLRVARSALTRQDERLLRRLPPIIRRQLESPYLDGFAFVNALRGRGDWAAVDAAWEERPRSTEQILHPELYPDEVPVEVGLPDLAAQLGSDWTTSYTQTLGEMQIGVWVADGRRSGNLLPGLPAPLPRADAAAGWGGDRLASLDGPEGAWAVVWQTDWDSAGDARQFRRAAVAVMKDLPGANAVLDADIAGGLSSPILVLVADSRSTLRVLRAALGLET
jgi:hypothetical protein